MTGPDGEGLPRLDEAPAFKLLLAANLLARPFLERVAPAEDLTLPEWRCMVALAARPDGANVEIAAATGLDAMTVSRALARLARRRRIARRRDRADGRRTASRLTAEGEALYRRLAVDAEARLATLMAGVTAEEAAAFAAVLDKMVAALRAADE